MDDLLVLAAHPSLILWGLIATGIGMGIGIIIGGQVEDEALLKRMLRRRPPEE